MLIDFIYVGLACILVPILRMRGLFGMEDLKNNVLTTLSVISLLIHIIVYGQIPIIQNRIGILFFYFLCILTVSLAWSSNKNDALFDLIRWWSLFYFFTICSHLPIKYILTAIFITAPFLAAYGLSQQFLSKDFIEPFYTKTLYKAKRLYSWLGNTNYVGSYLASCFFIGLYLMFYHSFFWAIGLIPVLVAIFYTKCRAAWLSLLAGICSIILILDYRLFPFMLIVLGLSFAKKRYRTMINESALGRIFYWKATWQLIKKYPFFGLGPRAFRYHLIDMQAEMNKKDPTILGNLIHEPKNPSLSARRVHNDHLETLLETGIIGFDLWIGIIFFILLGTFQDPILFGGIIAFIVNATFFFSIRTSATALPIMGLWVSASEPQFSIIQLSFLPGILITACILYLSYLFIFKTIKGNIYFLKLEDIEKIKEKTDIAKFSLEALKAEPSNNIYLHHHAALYRNHPEGFLAALKSIFFYDGRIIKWQLWHLAGIAALQNGLINFAKVAFTEALSLYPGYRPAHEGMKQIENISKSYEKITTRINEANQKRSKRMEKRKALMEKYHA